MRHRKKDKTWYYKHHKAMWVWLSKNPRALKSDWPGWNKFTNTYWEDCFACQYVIDHFKNDNDVCLHCKKCLLIWNTVNCEISLSGRDGLFIKWKRAKTNKLRTKYALQIANLPLRKS